MSRLDSGTAATFFKLANHVAKRGRPLMRGPDDRRMTVAGVDLDFTVTLDTPTPISTVVAPDWCVWWMPDLKNNRVSISKDVDGAFIRDLTYIMLSGAIHV